MGVGAVSWSPVLAALAGVIYVTFADVLLYRGWLGYRDPLVGMLVFGAIASLWMAVHTQRAIWLTATLGFATCAFLTKGIIAYVFVGAAVLVSGAVPSRYQAGRRASATTAL